MNLQPSASTSPRTSAGERYSGGCGPRPEFPVHLGFEAAGVVRAVGPDAVGPPGSVLVDGEVVPKPSNLAWEAGSGRCSRAQLRFTR